MYIIIYSRNVLRKHSQWWNLRWKQKEKKKTIEREWNRDVKFCIQIGSDWPQLGQIWDFLRSVSVQIFPILGQCEPIWMQNLTSLCLIPPMIVDENSGFAVGETQSH